jgi:hypothetical protein
MMNKADNQGSKRLLSAEDAELSAVLETGAPKAKKKKEEKKTRALF